MSRHLRVLREAGLVRDEIVGRERRYALDLDALAPLEAFLRELHAPTRAQAWSRRLDALETEVHRARRDRREGEAARSPAPRRKARAR
ncbi:MAG: helix-turn-helix transcriptional regulator [Myxococcales bacterium]|nr:helix-turn-helix transcriptional regulator [Myxococcales bacterium]